MEGAATTPRTGREHPGRSPSPPLPTSEMQASRRRELCQGSLDGPKVLRGVSGVPAENCPQGELGLRTPASPVTWEGAPKVSLRVAIQEEVPHQRHSTVKVAEEALEGAAAGTRSPKNGVCAHVCVSV